MFLVCTEVSGVADFTAEVWPRPEAKDRLTVVKRCIFLQQSTAEAVMNVLDFERKNGLTQVLEECFGLILDFFSAARFVCFEFRISAKSQQCKQKFACALRFDGK